MKRRTIHLAVRELCLAFPGAEETLSHGRPDFQVAGRSFATLIGRPVWKAGKKVFAGAFHHGGHLHFDFWVGVASQAMLTADARYTIPKYTGHSGWINLEVESRLDWVEIDGLLDVSYRHFVLKRMLKALDGG